MGTSCSPRRNIVTIQDLGSAGEFVAAIATVATLIYLAVQIRTSNRLARAEASRAPNSDLNALNAAFGTDPVFRAAMLEVLKGAERPDLEPAPTRSISAVPGSSRSRTTRRAGPSIGTSSAPRSSPSSRRCTTSIRRSRRSGERMTPRSRRATLAPLACPSRRSSAMARLPFSSGTVALERPIR